MNRWKRFGFIAPTALRPRVAPRRTPFSGEVTAKHIPGGYADLLPIPGRRTARFVEEENHRWATITEQRHEFDVRHTTADPRAPDGLDVTERGETAEQEEYRKWFARHYKGLEVEMASTAAHESNVSTAFGSAVAAGDKSVADEARALDTDATGQQLKEQAWSFRAGKLCN